MFYSVAPPRGERGLKLITLQIIPLVALVAPPRGERGLKLVVDITKQSTATSRSPSWGAWIEIVLHNGICTKVEVAPPRGERGLKSKLEQASASTRLVAPPRGERGLKLDIRPYRAFGYESLPLVGSVD